MAWDPDSLEEIAARIGAGEALVLYALTETRAFALLVVGGKYRIVDLGTTGEIRNAVEAIPDGDEGHVTITFGVQDGNAVFTVADDGVGMNRAITTVTLSDPPSRFAASTSCSQSSWAGRSRLRHSAI